MRSLAWNKEKNEMDSELLRERIFGGHIAEYQKMLIREEPKNIKKCTQSILPKESSQVKLNRCGPIATKAFERIPWQSY
jgi:hypothetical protein